MTQWNCKFAHLPRLCFLLATLTLWNQEASAQTPLACAGVEPSTSDTVVPAAREIADVFQDCVSDSTPEPICCSSDLWTRSTLTGDWNGYRSRLKEAGVTFVGNETQFGFGVAGGIYNPVLPLLGKGDTSKYTGRGQYELTLDLEKFGGLPKSKLFIGAQHWYGQFGNVSFNTGSFTPAVFPAALPPAPNDPGVPYLTDFLLTQPLSEKLVVWAGKKNVLGIADQDVFSGGNGTHQFVNQALIANPAFLLGLPYTSFTAGAALPQQWGMISSFIYDPQDRTTDVFRLDNLFSTGIIMGGEVKVNTNFFGLPGDQHVGGMWKHFDQPNLNAFLSPPSQYPEPSGGSATINDAYTIYYGFDQFLVNYGKHPKHGWGLFGRASISDGNPTPVRYFLSLGIGGDSPAGQHRGDTFGIGWYFVGATNQFGPIPQSVLGPSDGTGVEAFYNFQVTPWLNITPDVQYIHPGAGSAISNDAFVGGVRANVRL